MNTGICNAIQSKTTLQFSYDGGLRNVEPYCFGVSRRGNPVLRAYQTGGSSRSGRPVGWKLFNVSKIIGPIAHGDPFTSNRPEYNPNDRDMTTIYCRV
jgi:hypothetical protein